MTTVKDIILIIFLIAIVSATFMKCSNAQKKELAVEEAKLQVDADEDISARIDKMIKDADWPTEEQKNKLLDLKSTTKNKVQDINLKLKKAKILLVQNLIIKSSTNEKLRLLKKEIKKLYKQKVDIMLDAVEVARNILGKGNRVSQLDSMYHLYLLNEY